MKIVVCGGGISGISAAFYARKMFKEASKPCEIILIEKTNRVGGWMDTNVSNGNRKVYRGPINEKGPRSVRTNDIVGKNSLEFISNFNLANKIIPVKKTNISAKSRMLYVNKKIHKLPNSLLSSLQIQEPFSMPLAFTVVMGLLKQTSADLETVQEVMEARFGKEFSDIAGGAFCRGVFAADYKKLSLKAAFTSMWRGLGPRNLNDYPRKPELRNSKDIFLNALSNPIYLQANEWVQWTAKHGFSSLVEDMAKILENDMDIEILRNHEVKSFVRDVNGKFLVEYQENASDTKQIEEVDHIISALPSYSLSQILNQSKSNAQLLEKDKIVYSDLVDNLNKIKWVDVAIANVEYEGSPKENLPYLGFGHLVPPSEPSNLLGVVYDSCAFPQHDRLGVKSTRLTCMMGGSWFNEVFGTKDHISSSKIEQIALDGLDEQLDLYEDPVEIETNVGRKCIPLYRRGHTDVVEELEDMIDDNELEISLVGASYWGVSINDCIMNSRIAVSDILEYSVS